MFYPVQTNWLMRMLYPSCIWKMDAQEKKIYLSFDDGPHPFVTPFVLDTLKQYDAKATFFCIGKNVAMHQQVYARILQEGHAVGNHTQHHLNAWKVPTKEYVENMTAAKQFIDSNLFRPPYGKITRSAAAQLTKQGGMKIIMWSLLTGDFDTNITANDCWKNIETKINSGSIVVFHDSEKAWDRMHIVLPKLLQLYTEKGYEFEKIVL